jgi:6-phosphofructokinase 1
LNDAKKNFISLCIPLIVIPATISNNVPGTDWALGTDTALNVIMQSCDTIRQSAYSSRKRVFVVEVMGGDCGYLATMSGLASGATCAYIPEEGLNLDMLVRDCKHLIERYTDGENQGRIILRNECVSKTYTTEVVSNIFAEEGDGLFDSRSAILGHTQQGGVPSPFDRVRATRFAVKSIMWIEDLAFNSIDKHLAHVRTGQDKKLADRMASPFIVDVGKTISESESKVDLVEGGVYTDSPESSGVIGIRGSGVVITPVEELVRETDFEKRKPKDSSWQELNNLIRILAKYDMENYVGK